jgi:hypothetical protein
MIAGTAILKKRACDGRKVAVVARGREREPRAAGRAACVYRASYCVTLNDILLQPHNSYT